MDWISFGLGPNYRPILHEQILDLLDLSDGKLTWTEIYNMPIWLRKFYFKRYNERRSNQNGHSNQEQPLTDKIKRPNFLPRKSKD